MEIQQAFLLLIILKENLLKDEIREMDRIGDLYLFNRGMFYALDLPC